MQLNRQRKFNASPWKDQINIIHGDVKEFSFEKNLISSSVIRRFMKTN